MNEKFQDIEILENFVPRLNKKDQSKLAFVQASPVTRENKKGDEFPSLSFRFICEGVNGSRTITYTGWLYDALSERSKLGQILKAFKVVDFITPEAEKVEEFDFEENFKPIESNGNTIQLNEIIDKLEKLEGITFLAKLKCEDNVWHRPDPTTFEFPLINGKFPTTDVTEFKK